MRKTNTPAVPREAKDRVLQLKKAIAYHRALYHEKDREEIAPSALDSLKEELVKFEEKYPSLVTADSPTQRVAGKPLPEFKKVRHEVPQWSFNDAFSPEDIRLFDERVRRFLEKSGVTEKPTYTCELKIDGLKVVYEYKKGKLFRGATRGDGLVGEDVTHNIRTIYTVPLLLAEPVDCIVEGEVYMRKSVLLELNKERKKSNEEAFANPRNVAAGSIRQLDPGIEPLRILGHPLLELEHGLGRQEELNAARGAGALVLQRHDEEVLRFHDAVPVSVDDVLDLHRLLG